MQCDRLERQGRGGGLCAQSLARGLRSRLSEFYRLMVVLDSEREKLTARRLLVWCQQPAHRLTILADIAQQCIGMALSLSRRLNSLALWMTAHLACKGVALSV